MDVPNTPPQPPARPSPDTVVVAAPVARPRIPANATLTPLVRDAIARLHAVHGAATYAAALVALRQAQGAPAFLADAYRAAPAREHLERWSIITVLGDLHQPDALAPLQAIAVAPLPRAIGEDAPQVLAEETMIRTAAVEGIARQAAGNAGARALLLETAKSPVFSVRRAAAQAYLALGGARVDLEKVLPADQRFLLDLRAVSAAQLPAVGAPSAAAGKPGREAPAPGTPGAPGVVAAPDAPARPVRPHP